MKTLLLILGLFISSFATNVFAQDEEEVLTPDEKMELVVPPDNVMKQVVQKMVTEYFKPTDNPQKVYFFDRMIKKEWMPSIRNVEFIVLNPEQAKVRGKKAHVFSSIEKRKDGLFRVLYGFGDPECGTTTGDIWYFRLSLGQVVIWKAKNEGWGSGCGNGSGH